MTKVDEELNKILSDKEGDDNSGQASGAADDSNKDQKQDQGQKNEEEEQAKKKQEHLDNLNRAISEAEGELQKIRKDKRTAQGLSDEEEQLPKINMEDPNSKAWDKHISDKVSPVQAQIEQEKTEVRNLALDEFLSSKPALAKNEAKLKEVMAAYNALSTAAGITEKNKDVVIKYMEKAYAAVFHDQLLSAARQARIEQAEEDTVLSDIAVSRGATNYREQKESLPIKLTRDDEKAILAMGYTSVEAWMEDYKKYSLPK